MLLRLSNRPRDYAWGSTTAIPEFLGVEPDGSPQAELWLGSHPGSPSRLHTPESDGPETADADLREWLRDHPQPGTRADGELPFLLKVLAPEAPLSIQVHPTPAQAAEGHAREDRAGVPVDAAHRNYKDAFHKPELIYALSSRFSALCGFRPVAEVRTVIESLAAAAPGGEGAVLLGELLALLDPAEEEASRRSALSWAFEAPNPDALVAGVAEAVAAHGTSRRPDLATIADLARRHPADPGVAVALLMNRVTLRRGQVLYLPAGNLHAYLAGFGVELMAASDNVIRGGLTPKHVDVAELLDVLDLRTLPVPILKPQPYGQGVRVYRPDVPDFALFHVRPDRLLDAVVRLAAPAIVLAAEGRISLEGSRGRLALERGQAAFATPDEGPLTFRGEGEAFLATAGERTA